MMSFSSSCLCAADAAPRPPAGSAYPHPTHHSIAQDLASTISPWFLFCLREERMDSSSVRPQLHLIWSEQICCQLPLCSVQGQGSMICDRRERCCRGIRRVCHQWWGARSCAWWSRTSQAAARCSSECFWSPPLLFRRCAQIGGCCRVGQCLSLEFW